MREIVNPYKLDSLPESRQYFFGRDDIIIWLEQQFIARRRVILLHGPKQIGKTTLLHFLPNLLSARPISIRFYLERLGDFSLNMLLNYILQSLTEQAMQQGLITQDKIVTASDPVSGIENILIEIQSKDPHGDILFLIDDFDRILDLTAEGAEVFLDACQDLLTAHERLRLILTVSDTSLPRLHHPILASAPTRQIPPLNGESALQLTTQPVEGVLRFDYGVTRRIAELNSNHPYYLTMFNQVLFNRYAREGWVNLRHLDETIEVVLAMQIPAFESIWQNASWVERVILVAMASVKGSHGVLSQQEIISPLLTRIKQVDDKLLLTALESLTFQGVLVKMGASSYRFFVDLFRYWLEQRFDLEPVLNDVVWKEPATRPEAVDSTKVSKDKERRKLFDVRLGKVPGWVLATAAAVIIGSIFLVALVVGILLSNSRSPITSGADEPASGADVSPQVAVTPSPLPPPTPTAPLVVARALPSIAYMARQGDTPWQIHVMGIDGSGNIPLSDLAADDTTPIWSPQGDKISFVSRRDNNREIYIMSSDGSNLINLTNNPADDWTPAWTPDGSQIAFSSNRRGHWEIFIINADGTNLQQITNTGTGNISPVWSPDGQYLAYSSKRDGNWEIYSMRLDGSELRRLTDNNVNDLAPVWSYSGAYIAYETDIEGNVEIYLMDHNGENQRNISNLPYADDHGPVWSPDDERLVFYSNREGNWDLFSVGIDGSNTINLTNTPATDEQTPAWRP